MGPHVLTALAHADVPVTPANVTGFWHADPAVLAGLGVALLVHRRGRRDNDSGWRTTAFHLALATLAVALLSPLDAAATALMSAHMLQHDLLLLVVAPLLVLARPGPRLLRGLPGVGRRTVGRTRRVLRLGHRHARGLRHPVLAVTALVAVLWSWHAAGPYTAAQEDPLLHATQHVTMLAGGWLFWSAVAAAVRGRRHGVAVAMLFVAGLQGVWLGMLLMFSADPWYDVFETSTGPWGLTPIVDQQIAGVVLWLPGSLLFATTAIAVVVRALRDDNEEGDAHGELDTRPGPALGVGPGSGAT